MKSSIKLAVIVLFLLLYRGTTFAQSVKPYFDYLWFDQDNAIAQDTTIVIGHIRIKSCDTNVDTTVIGHLQYYYQTQKTISNYGNFFFVPMDPFPGLIDTIYPGGILKNIPFLCDTNYLEPRITETGPANVIIIWPAFVNPAIGVCDSGQYTLTDILIEPGAIGIQEEPIQKFGSTVFPNPSEGIELVMFNSKYIQEIQQITVTNTIGQTMSVVEFADGESSHGFVLPTENLQSGIYHIHVLYKDRKREVVKFIKN